MSRDAERDGMVANQLRDRGIQDEHVLEAMAVVPRHGFVLESSLDHAYADRPLSIGHDATISQPYIVALMTELAQVKPGDRVLDVGTGSGYQAAVLVEMGAEVFGIERVEELTAFACARLEASGYAADVITGDGYGGRPEHAPYAAIICAAAADEVPTALLEQLEVGGRLVIPVGSASDSSVLKVVTHTEGGDEVVNSIGVRFVPLRHGPVSSST